MPWEVQTPIMMDCDTADLCKRPYPGHKRGCPNYGKRDSCPPKVWRWDESFRHNSKCTVIWITFPFGKHVTKMQFKHPDWSKRQLECCLYWQGTARKALRSEVGRFLSQSSNTWTVFYVPEAHGVNVTSTMAELGHTIEWPPIHRTFHVAIAIEDPNGISLSSKAPNLFELSKG